MNKKLTKQQYDLLKPLEVFLYQASHDFLVNQTKANKQLVFSLNKEIFGATTGRESCPTCVLREYKRLAELYFNYQEEVQKAADASILSHLVDVTPEDNVVSEDITVIKTEEPVEDKVEEPEKPVEKKTTKRNKKN